MTASDNKTAKVVHVVLDVYASVDHGTKPQHASFELTEAFLQRCAAVESALIELKLSEARFTCYPSWLPADVEQSMRLQRGELVVDDVGAVHFTDYPKYGDYNITSESVDIAQLRMIFANFEDGAVVRRSAKSGGFEVRSRYIVSHGWPHFFEDDVQQATRWVLDTEAKSLLLAQVEGQDGWSDLASEDRADLLHSLLDNEVHLNPDDFDVEQSTSAANPFVAEADY